MKKVAQKRYTTWIVCTVLFTVVALALFASMTIYIDPLFHYHGPLDNYEYPLKDEDERYQNDGITRHFEYDSIITGTSMAQNFMTSEADQIYHGNFIKICFSGGLFKEINDNLERTYPSGKNIKYVIRTLDYYVIDADKDACKQGE